METSACRCGNKPQEGRHSAGCRVISNVLAVYFYGALLEATAEDPCLSTKGLSIPPPNFGLKQANFWPSNKPNRTRVVT